MENIEASFTEASPRPGSVRDSWGDPCDSATPESYPLRARCEHCMADIRCADGTASWTHKRGGVVCS